MQQVDPQKDVSQEIASAPKKKPPLPIIMFFIMMGFFSLVIAPFLGAVSQPNRNLHRIKVLFADFDGGWVGATLNQYVSKFNGMDDFFAFEFITDASSPVDLKKRVLNNHEGWAAVYANPGSSASLLSVIADNCSASYGYNATNALTFIWDEGRSPTFTARVFATMSGVLSGLSTLSSVELLYLRKDLGLNVETCLANGGSAFLAEPISYTTINLTPASIKAPVASGLITIGNILIAVFGSIFFVNIIYKPLLPSYEHLPYMQQACFRAVLFVVYDFGIAAVAVTVVVGLAIVGPGRHTYSGVEWAQMVAAQWLHGLSWSFLLASFVEGMSLEVVALPFAFFLISNIIGGWNTDIADVGYQNFYQIFPFNWVNNILKNVMYGSMPGLLRMSCGILIGETAFLIMVYFFLAHRNAVKIEQAASSRKGSGRSEINPEEVVVIKDDV